MRCLRGDDAQTAAADVTAVAVLGSSDPSWYEDARNGSAGPIRAGSIGRCRSLKLISQSRHSRRIVPIGRSQKAFASGVRHGQAHEERTTAGDVAISELRLGERFRDRSRISSCFLTSWDSATTACARPGPASRATVAKRWRNRTTHNRCASGVRTRFEQEGLR
jgi:hypothetical protein